MNRTSSRRRESASPDPGDGSKDSQESTRVLWRERFVRGVAVHPRPILAFWAVLIAVSMALLPHVTKETGVDGYLAADNPAVVSWRQTQALFDLYDPVVVLIETGKPDGAFSPSTLGLVQWFTDALAEVEGIDPEGIQSIATESRVYGTEEGVEIEPLMAAVPQNEEEAAAVRDAVRDFTPYVGLLASEDGSAAVITARLTNPELGGAIYHALRALVERAPLQGETVHIAGEAVMGEYLGEVLDRDAFRLNPLVAAVVGFILFLSYRTVRSIALPGLAAFSGVVVTVGLMAMFRIPYQLLTNILPAVLLAIGVAYGLHLVGEFYEQVAADPEGDPVDRVVRTALRMWRPVTFTALTDVVAFLDLAATSSMPPIRRFGALSSLGVLVTFAFTLTAIPAALALLPAKPSSVFRSRTAGRHYGRDLWHRAIEALNRFVVAHPRPIVAAAALVTLPALWGATRLEVNDERASNFSPSEPIHQAAHAINDATDGTVILDIVVETDEPEGLFLPENLRRIDALQQYAETLPHVGDTQSLADFVKEIHRALRGGAPEAAVLPDSEDMIAQALLLASMGDLSDVLVHYADSDYRRANVRVFHKSGYYSHIRHTRETLDEYLRTQFNGPGIRAHISGRMNMLYTWMRSVAADHFTGVAIGLLLVWIVVSLSFRYFWIGLYAVVPVSATLLGIYAAMGLGGITLGVGTSAFAAIAIGLTVDFAIHVLDHMLILTRDEGCSLPEAVARMYPSTGRAVLFSFLCVFLGMCVLTLSELPPLYLFAVLLAVSLLVSFLASLVVLPALLLVTRPKFLTAAPARTKGAEEPARKTA